MNRIASQLSKRLLLILAVVCASCLPSVNDPSFIPTAEYLGQNSIPRPEFVARINPEPTEILANAERLCILIYQGALWHPGEDAEALQSHIVNNTVFRINNRVIRPESVSYTDSFPRGSDGQITDEFGPNLQFCYMLSLENGVYVASLETYSLTVERFCYSWAINVG